MLSVRCRSLNVLVLALMPLILMLTVAACGGGGRTPNDLDKLTIDQDQVVLARDALKATDEATYEANTQRLIDDLKPFKASYRRAEIDEAIEAVANWCSTCDFMLRGARP